MSRSSSAAMTCLAAGTLSVVYAGLQTRVGLHRLGSGIKFGTTTTDGKGEDENLTIKMRAGGNMQEYVPMGLILMFLLETATPLKPKWVATFGAILVASRLVAAYGIANTLNPCVPSGSLRKYGFLGTIGCLVAGGSYLMVTALQSLRK